MTIVAALGIYSCGRAVEHGVLNYRPPCVWRVSMPQELWTETSEALDQMQGHTGIEWQLVPVDHANLVFTIEPGLPPETLGTATATVHLVNIVHVDIAINPATVTAPYLIRVLVHEIAHAVGLGHSDDPTSLFAPGFTPTSVLQAADISALKSAGASCHG